MIIHQEREKQWFKNGTLGFTESKGKTKRGTIIMGQNQSTNEDEMSNEHCNRKRKIKLNHKFPTEIGMIKDLWKMKQNKDIAQVSLMVPYDVISYLKRRCCAMVSS